MAELLGMPYLQSKLVCKKTRVDLRYGFYEMKNRALDFGISTPPNLLFYNSAVGWCAKGVDAMADRLVWREFRNDNFDLNGIFDVNNRDILFDSAVLSALISSCCFVYISTNEDGFPRLQVVDGGNATGVIDPITGLLTEGYAVLERDKFCNPLIEAYFTPYSTTVYEAGEVINEYNHGVGYPLLVPIIHRPDAKRPFGHSRISRACMSLTDAALRTIKRGEISAEFYSYPQKYATGLSESADELDRWRASMSSMITFTKDEDGDRPTLGQFTQASMEPHLEQLRSFASLFAGETGLTLDDLGFPSDTPSSAESIKAAHENMRLAARKAQRCFGSGFLNVGYLAACIRDKISYKREQLYLTRPVWEPIFEPDAAAISLIGDGAIKINQAIPGFFSAESLRDFTGIIGESNNG